MWLRGVKLIVVGLLGFCASIGSAAFAQQEGIASDPKPPKISYAVEDLVLGDKINADTLTHRVYNCRPSEQFDEFTWCTNRTSKGRAYTAYSILHSSDGTIVYANKTSEPAFSSPNEAKEELQRISRKIGAQPRIIDMPSRQGLPEGLIAVWGNVVLTPVDADNVKKLAEGRSPKLGFMVDFITDFGRSAKMGLPIYKIGGNAGSVLALSYGKPDRGTFRFIAVDAAKLTSPATATAPAAAQPSPVTDQAQAPAAVQPSPAQNKVAIGAQPSSTLDQTAIVAKPSLQPTDKENESQTNIAELKHAISLLRAELATAASHITKLENQNSETERQLKQEAQARLSAEAAKNQIEQTMLQSQKATQLWTILADVLVGSLIALLAIGAPILWNHWTKFKMTSKPKLSSLTPWAKQLHQKISPSASPKNPSQMSWINTLPR